MFHCQADTVQHGPGFARCGTVPTQALHSPAWPGAAWSGPELTDRSEWVCSTARRGWPTEARDWPVEVRDWLVEVRGVPRPNEVPLRMDNMVNRSEGFWGRSDAAQAVADTAQNGLAWSDTVPTGP